MPAQPALTLEQLERRIQQQFLWQHEELGRCVFIDHGETHLEAALRAALATRPHPLGTRSAARLYPSLIAAWAAEVAWDYVGFGGGSGFFDPFNEPFASDRLEGRELSRHFVELRNQFPSAVTPTSQQQQHQNLCNVSWALAHAVLPKLLTRQLVEELLAELRQVEQGRWQQLGLALRDPDALEAFLERRLSPDVVPNGSSLSYRAWRTDRWLCGLVLRLVVGADLSAQDGLSEQLEERLRDRVEEALQDLDQRPGTWGSGLTRRQISEAHVASATDPAMVELEARTGASGPVVYLTLPNLRSALVKHLSGGPDQEPEEVTISRLRYLRLVVQGASDASLRADSLVHSGVRLTQVTEAMWAACPLLQVQDPRDRAAYKRVVQYLNEVLSGSQLPAKTAVAARGELASTLDEGERLVWSRRPLAAALKPGLPVYRAHRGRRGRRGGALLEVWPVGVVAEQAPSQGTERLRVSAEAGAPLVLGVRVAADAELTAAPPVPLGERPSRQAATSRRLVAGQEAWLHLPTPSEPGDYSVVLRVDGLVPPAGRIQLRVTPALRAVSSAVTADELEDYGSCTLDALLAVADQGERGAQQLPLPGVVVDAPPGTEGDAVVVCHLLTGQVHERSQELGFPARADRVRQALSKAFIDSEEMFSNARAVRLQLRSNAQTIWERELSRAEVAVPTSRGLLLTEPSRVHAVEVFPYDRPWSPESLEPADHPFTVEGCYRIEAVFRGDCSPRVSVKALGVLPAPLELPTPPVNQACSIAEAVAAVEALPRGPGYLRDSIIARSVACLLPGSTLRSRWWRLEAAFHARDWGEGLLRNELAEMVGILVPHALGDWGVRERKRFAREIIDVAEDLVTDPSIDLWREPRVAATSASQRLPGADTAAAPNPVHLGQAALVCLGRARLGVETINQLADALEYNRRLALTTITVRTAILLQEFT